MLLDAANLITEFVAYGGADVRVDREVAIVNGAVGSDKSLRIGRDADTHGLYAGDRAWIDRDTEVHGDIRASDRVEVRHNSVVAGDIDAGGLVRLRRSVQVQGDVTSANRVLQEPGVAVAGTVTEFGHPEPFDSVPLPPVTSFTAGSQDVSTNQRARLWLTPGKYGKLDVGRDSELHLTAGDYFFDELKADRDFLIDFDVTGGDIAIFVTGSVQFDQGLDVDVVGGTAADVYLRDARQLPDETEWRMAGNRLRAARSHYHLRKLGVCRRGLQR